MNGYDKERYAHRLIEPLYAIALAYSDNQHTAAIVSPIFLRSCSRIPMTSTNGSEGYFPTDAALNDKGYESSSSLFLPGVASNMVNASLALLNKLKV